MESTQISRHTSAAAESPGMGSAVQISIASSKAFTNRKFGSENDPVPKQLNLDEFLRRKSARLKGYYSDEDMHQLCIVNADSIGKLEVRFENLLFGSNRWRSGLKQIPEAATLEETLRQWWELKKSYLFRDVYRLIFEKNVNGYLVFLGLRKALEERCFFSEFSDALSDPLTLMVTSVMEYAKYTEANCKSGLTASKS